jgi:transcription-repair coupling factor (superfamily II helicase)
MRDLRLRALESGPGRLVVTLGADASLDPAKTAALIQRSKGIYRLTPEMKLVAKRQGPDQPIQLLAEAKKVLGDLAACAAT